MPHSPVRRKVAALALSRSRRGLPGLVAFGLRDPCTAGGPVLLGGRRSPVESGHLAMELARQPVGRKRLFSRPEWPLLANLGHRRLGPGGERRQRL